MRTRSFDFFCTPEELSEILIRVSEDLADVSFFTEGPKGDLPLKHVGLREVVSDWPKVLWANTGKAEPKSFLGLVRVRPPRYRGRALCMASFAIKAEIDKDKENVGLYERLKRIMRLRLKPGLWGVNTKYGGERFYRDIYISDGAIDEFRSRSELAPEAGDGFVRFYYRSDNPAGHSQEPFRGR